eukprot:632293-Heterocapsa_arctica.AAC.1
MDANAHVGHTRRSNEGSSAFGPYQQEVESWSGARLRESFSRLDLILLNTWIPSASGSRWTDGRNFTRIDDIAAPRPFLNCIQDARVFNHTAYDIQLSTALRWIDHAPLVVNLFYRDWRLTHAQCPGTTWPRSALRPLQHDSDKHVNWLIPCKKS